MTFGFRLPSWPNSGARVAIPIALSLGAALGVGVSADAGPRQIETAALPSGGKALDEGATLPSILSVPDVSTYQAIFRNQEAGNWAAADRDLKFLRDGRLLGHVMAQ